MVLVFFFGVFVGFVGCLVLCFVVWFFFLRKGCNQCEGEMCSRRVGERGGSFPLRGLL